VRYSRHSSSVPPHSDRVDSRESSGVAVFLGLEPVDPRSSMSDDAELNALLGDSDDEEEKMEVEEPKKAASAESAASELNDMLGDSDDEDEGKKDASEEQKAETEIKSEKTQDLQDLLGGDSDDDEEKEVKAEYVKEEVNELDQILGKVEGGKGGKVLKSRTQAKLVVPSSYRVGDNSSLFLRTPNFIKIQGSEFDESTHDPMGEKGTFMGTTAVLRWRSQRDDNGDLVMETGEGREGRVAKESNARMVVFEDGSMQLLVGDATFLCKREDVENW
jgi:hypothetical protein